MTLQSLSNAMTISISNYIRNNLAAVQQIINNEFAIKRSFGQEPRYEPFRESLVFRASNRIDCILLQSNSLRKICSTKNAVKWSI